MARAVRKLDQRARVRNRFRFREEVSNGIFNLMRGKSQTWLAGRLGVSRSRVCQMLEGSGNNFEIDTIADLALALNRGVHIVFGARIDETRVAHDEAKDEPVQKPQAVIEAATALPDDPSSSRMTLVYRIENYRHLVGGGQSTTTVPVDAKKLATA